MILHADVLVGLQAGDEGKGKITHALLHRGGYDLVVRYNGGSNAGHTVYHNGHKIVTHQVPMGVLFGIPSIIGLGCVVNLEKLEQELQDLHTLGINTTDLVFIDKRAHVVTPEHLIEDNQDTRLGTTRQGIGPAYRHKYGRTGVRMEDVEVSPSAPFKMIDSYDMFFNRNGLSYRVFCEGAQGWQIDVDWGDYPYVTSSHCTVGSACLNGIPPKKIRDVIGTMKAYETYSGFKQTFMDENDQDLVRLQVVGQEFGATTGRARKTRWLDLDEVIRACNVNGVTKLYINKVDILEEVGTFKYIYKQQQTQCGNSEKFCTTIASILRKETSVQEVIWSRSPNGI
jgi:adenylosuccinate synthase